MLDLLFFRLGKVWMGVRDQEYMARIGGLRKNLLDTGTRMERQHFMPYIMQPANSIQPLIKRRNLCTKQW